MRSGACGARIQANGRRAHHSPRRSLGMRSKKALVAIGALATVLAVAITAVASGGVSLKSLVKQEVAKQLSGKGPSAQIAAKGRRGPAGPQGPAGPAGATGATGGTGAAGAAGSAAAYAFVSFN